MTGSVSTQLRTSSIHRDADQLNVFTRNRPQAEGWTGIGNMPAQAATTFGSSSSTSKISASDEDDQYEDPDWLTRVQGFAVACSLDR